MDTAVVLAPQIIFFAVLLLLIYFVWRLGNRPRARSAPKPEPGSLFDSSYQRLVLTFPPDKLNPTLSIELINAFSHLSKPPILQLSVTSNSVQLALICRPEETQQLKQAVFGVTSQVDIHTAELLDYPLYLEPRTCTFTRDSRDELYPLATIDSFDTFDPISTILSAITPLQEDQWVSLYFILREPDIGNMDRLRHQAFEISSYDRLLYRKLTQRVNDYPCFEAFIVLAVAASNPEAIGDKAQTVARTLVNRFAAGHAGAQHSLDIARWQRSPSPYPTLPKRPRSFVISSPELASFWHPISAQVSTPGVQFLKSSPQTLPLQLGQTSGIPLGTVRQRGEDTLIRLPVEDLQLGHAVLLGKTRVGKTTLAHHIARSIKELVPDSSLVILDPNGDWATDYALRSVPPERVDKTYLLEFGNSEYPPSLPILIPPPGVSIDTFIKTTFETIKLIFRDQWSSTRMETIMFNTVAALAEVKGSTLLDVERLYTNPGFRRKVIQQITDEPIRDYWLRYDQLSNSAQYQRVEPILSRISVFTRSRAIRNITCRTDAGLDIAKVIEEGSDLLISTVGADIHDEADLLIEFLVSRVHLAMFSRLGTAGSRRPVFLMIDESQHIKGASFPTLFSEAAKTGLCVIALTQYLHQWDERVSQAILGNVGTIITFQIGPNDSRKLAHSLSPYGPEQAENLDKFEALVKMRVDGKTMPAFEIKTLPLQAPANAASLDTIKQRTRERFTKSRQELSASTPAPSQDGAASKSGAGWDIFDVGQDVPT